MTKTELMTNFGINLKNALDEWDMTQKELADEIHVSKQTISSYVQGERMPSIENLINIAHVFDCDLDDLIPRLEKIDI